MLVFTKCCYCVKLKTGCYIIAGFEILGHICDLLVAYYTDEISVYRITMRLTLFCLTLVLIGALAFNHREALHVHLVSRYVLMLVLLVCIILFPFFLRHNDNFNFIYAYLTIYFLSHIYCTAIVWSLHQVMMNPELQTGPTDEPRLKQPADVEQVVTK